MNWYFHELTGPNILLANLHPRHAIPAPKNSHTAINNKNYQKQRKNVTPNIKKAM